MDKYNLKYPIRRDDPFRSVAEALKTSKTAKYLVDRKFELHGPRKALLADIMYIPYAGMFAYLLTIPAAYTKQILTYVLSDKPPEDFVLETINKFICNREASSINVPKMNCWNNVPPESFFDHVKDEIGEKIAGCSRFEKVRQIIDNWMDAQQ